MVGGGMGRFWTCFALLAAASAGPLHRYPRESEDYQNDLSVYANYTANEVCFSEGEVFQKGDMMPNPGPCEECRCEPPSIVCNMIKCPVNNNGCRTIQRANHCCPDYNCECDYNGQLYNDGERLDLPEEPCQVCYCKGGEVMCNSITCYHRDDCDPIQVPGQCCPKYENCPVRDMGSSSSDDKNVLIRSTNKTHQVPPKREMNPWLLTKVPSASSSPPAKPSLDPTTEGETVIIVSDWLTERRTTTEDAAKPYYTSEFTVEPNLFTHPDHLTTDLRQDVVSDGSVVMKNSNNITPVDEVIFTRIDGPKSNKEERLEGPVSVSSKESEKPTGTVGLESSTESLKTEVPLGMTEVKQDLKQHTIFSEKENISGVISSKTPVTIGTTTELPVRIQEPLPSDKSILPTITLHPDTSKTASSDYILENLPSKGIILDNIFGLEGLTLGENEEDTTTKDIEGYETTESKDLVTDINELTGNVLEEERKGNYEEDKEKITLDESIITSDGFLDASTISVAENEATTPFFTEVNLENHSSNKQVEATVLPKLKEASFLDLNKLDFSTSGNKEEVSTSENALLTETIITTTDGTIEVKIKRNNFNVTGFNNAAGIPTLLNSSEITDPVTTQQPVVISEVNVKLGNVVVNDTEFNTNVASVGMVKDSGLPTQTNVGESSTDILDSTTDTLSTPKHEWWNALYEVNASDTPPVLELNSHVPFLQLGGHESTDSAVESHQPITVNENGSDALENESIPKLTLTKSDSHVLPVKQINDKISSQKISGGDEIIATADTEVQTHYGENDKDTETTTDAVVSTSHIPLTPGDLKAIAEYLINDTIKTVPVKNESEYKPNPWLRGNLTSEKKMSSILSAANISIAVMNKTDDKAKSVISEINTKTSESIKFDKVDKEKIVLGKKSLNDLKLGNKTGHIQGKSDEYFNSPKINSEPETHMNDEAKETLTPSKLDNKDASNSIKKLSVKVTAPNVNEDTNSKVVKSVNKVNEMAHSSTPLSASDSTNQNLRFDNVNPARDAETYQNERNIVLRNEKLSDVTTTSTTHHEQKLLTP